MTSSNVSNMLFQVSNINVEMPDIKADMPNNNGLFETTLKNVAGPNVSAPVNQNDLPKPKTNSIEAATAKLSNPKDAKLKSIEKEEEPVDAKEAIGKLEEVTTKVKEVISEELEASDEEIATAMETLGLTMIDLLDPQKLAELVSELTGEEDSFALVISDEFKNILDTVTELTDQLFNDTGITLLDAKELFASEEFAPAIAEMVDNQEAELPQLDINAREDLKQPVAEKELELEQPVLKETVNSDIKQEQINKQELAEPVEEDIPTIENAESSQSNNKESNRDFLESNTQSPKTSKQAIANDSQPVIRTDGLVFAEQRVEAQFVVEEQIVTLPTGETVSADDIVNQLVEQARVLSNTESTTMEMTLNPEGLGKIFMEVTQKGDEITAKIFTENDAVKQALEAQMANLRIEMNQNSTKVTSIEVSVGTHEFERNLEEDARNDERRDEQSNQSQKRSSKINLNSLDDLNGIMSDEDMLIAQMMKDNGNTLDFQA